MEAQLNQTFGDYTLEKKLGQGGMAVTYIARESMDGIGDRLVAIKQILPEFAADPAFRQMFYDEVRVTSLLTHRNICRIYRAGEVDGTLFMSMEFIDGMPLEDMVDLCQARGYLIPMDHALHIVSQTLEGLHAAHTQKDADAQPLNLVHRDVSPQNLLVSKKAELKLIDFGVAKAASNMTKTQAGAIKGKILYLSPEQLQGHALDGRSDLYSVGLMLYELLTGIHPFKGTDETSTIYNYITKDLEPPSIHNPSLPAEVDHFMMRALARERDERYQSAAEMSRGITDLLYAISPAYRGYHFEDFVAWCFSDDETTPPPSPFAQGVDPSMLSGSGPAVTTGPGIQGFANTAPAMSQPSLMSSMAASRPGVNPMSDPSMSGVQPAMPASKPTGLIIMVVVLVLLVIGGGVVLALTLAGGDDKDSDSGEKSSSGKLDDSGAAGDENGINKALGQGSNSGSGQAGGGSDSNGAAGGNGNANNGGAGQAANNGGSVNNAGGGDDPIDDGGDEDPPIGDDDGGEEVGAVALVEPDDENNGSWGTFDDDGDPDENTGGSWGTKDPDENSGGSWGTKDSGTKEAGGSWGTKDSGTTTTTKKKSSGFNPTKPSSVSLKGDSLKTLKILMIQFPEIEGTRVETYYRLALGSQNMPPKEFMKNTWDLCQHVKKKPWNSKEKTAIDTAFGGSDPCQGFYNSPDPRTY